MNVFRHRPTLRWAVPLLAAVLLGAGGSAVGVINATARDGLPQRSASQLLVDIQNARLDGLSGTIVQNAELGLPSLPGLGGDGSSDMRSLVSGSHTLRVWHAGSDRVRVALLGSLGESDLVRNGNDLWLWSSKEKSAVHHTIPASEADTPDSLGSMSPGTPQQAADAALGAISSTTKVSTDGTAVVAGRSAYELVLQPRDSRSLVESVRIAVDGKTHVPTRVRVFADDTPKPAFEVGFTSFDPTEPPASVFRFNPPPGTKVTEGDSRKGAPGFPDAEQVPQGLASLLSGARPRVVGAGWTSVLVAQVPSEATREGGQLAGTLDLLPEVSGRWGSGHLLRGSLFSVLVTDDGRIALGAVPPRQLYAALAGR